MADGPMTLIAELLAVVGDANTPRAAVRAFATVLGTRATLVRVELGDAIAEPLDGEWRCVERSSRPGRSIALAPGLAVVPARGAALPAYVTEASFRAALARIVELVLGHLSTVQRVAGVSRRAHVASRELRADLERLAVRPTVVAKSPAMRIALERGTLVAPHPTSVLLIGESGTGKEVLAAEIHRLSPRASRPMLQVNCGAIPDALVESELFGHERGAFTGADRVHLGVFERAHRGTLLLDEVGDLPPPAQVKLLRVLQERRIRRVGGGDEIPVDVRIIAATNRPLAALVRDGRFREDLFYRLDVFSIALPPLRERREDLGPLTVALVRDLAARLGLTAPPLTRAILDQLAGHDWPGNVRELANVLEGAIILGGGRALELPPSFAPGPRLRARTFEAAMRQTIEHALRATRGKIYGRDGAAAQLELDPGTLQSKMKKLGIDRRRFVRA